MVDDPKAVVNILLELNVLNLEHIERELRNLAARAVHPQAKRWLQTVARNYIINLEGQEAETEYSVYSPKRPKKGIHTDMPEPERLPDWAKRTIGDKGDVHFFDPAQPRRRQLWQDLETIVDWFNTWPANDPAINRLDRVNFQSARQQAKQWRAEIDKNPWLHIKDKPQVVKTYPDGMKWVRMSTDMHLTREGQLMGHCVGGGSYSHYMKNGTRAYFSLRDPKNEPHVTIEADIKGDGYRTVQVKGKENRAPIAKYQPYVRDFLSQPGWEVVGDKHNVQ
jgi:hypothetical protein